MPTYDFLCDGEACKQHGVKFESLLRRWDDPNPACPSCGAGLTRLASAPKAIWLKNWADYGLRQSDIESGQYNPDGVTAYRVKSTRHVDGTPEKVLLTSRQEAKTFCKDEGLSMPDEMNPNVTVRPDGKGMDTAGLPGQWV